MFVYHYFRVETAMRVAKPSNKFEGYALILGAGASHSTRGTPFNPPLDGNFLMIAKERLSRRDAPSKNKEVWSQFIAKLKHAGLSEKEALAMRLEQLSTYLEARANLPSMQLKQGRPAQYREALVALKSVICSALFSTGGGISCPLHKKLIRHINPRCILTFNYDMIVDQSLMEIGKLAYWHSSYAGGSILSRTNDGGTHAVQLPRWRRKKQISLYKLHGSINWQEHKKKDGFSLLVENFSQSKKVRDKTTVLKLSAPADRSMIVPPVAAKMNVRSEFLKKIWSAAAKDLRSASGWIIWGYSFPVTDTLTQVLFRTALRRNRKPKPVIIINPDRSVFESVKKTVAKVRLQKYSMSIEHFLLDVGVMKL